MLDTINFKKLAGFDSATESLERRQQGVLKEDWQYETLVAAQKTEEDLAKARDACWSYV